MYANYNNLINLNINNCFSLNPEEEEIVVKGIISEELENNRAFYQKVRKQTINQKNLCNENVKKIEELKKEIIDLKNPEYKSMSNLSELYSGNNLTTNPCTYNTYKAKEKEKESQKNNENNLKNEEILKVVKEELNTNKNLIEDLSHNVEYQKKLNEKVDQENMRLNDELSDKFSLIFQLEMELEKLRNKSKKKIIKEKVKHEK